MIDVSHAEIHTATVSLKMITVNQRQMTLSVFRQIPQKQLISETMELIGTPWGWVNYFWPDVKLPHDAINPIQVVWQQDSTLFRSVFATLPSEMSYPQHGGLHSWRHILPGVMVAAYEEAVSGLGDSQRAVWLKLTKKYHTLTQELSAMDQLFIAVGGGGSPKS